MKTKTGMSIGLALTLMVGVFATMLALGLFTPNEARAEITVPTVVHDPNDTGVAAEVTVTFVTSDALTTTSEIEIAFHTDVMVPITSDIVAARVSVSDGTRTQNAGTVTASGDQVMVTVPDMDGEAGTVDGIAASATVTVVFAEDFGIMNPANASTDADEYKVTVSTTNPITNWGTKCGRRYD